jgi:hypothetical protein
MLKMVGKLQSLCEQRRPVTLTAGLPGRILKGRFRFCSGSSGFAAIELFDLPEDAQILECTPCTVLFADGARSTLFISEIITLDTENHQLPVLRIRIPLQTASAEARNNLRIPLERKTAPSLVVRAPDQIWRPRPLDISIAGMLVELPEGESFPVADLEELEIEIAKDGLRTVIEGFAQHRWETFWILYFSDVLRSLRHGDPEVPEQLQMIIDVLETEWLKRH